MSRNSDPSSLGSFFRTAMAGLLVGGIGYGGGYYDRAIERIEKSAHKPLLIGMAFDVQQADQVPMDHFDRYLDGILTQSGYKTTPPAS